ncbi:amidase family protein [Neorhizobium sp. NCHU2750]|uniref:amidase family protein n=1 Tax=Neorhizobium sp. NCHU2750 TaxID=1825976 RepID=UPI0013C43D72
MLDGFKSGNFSPVDVAKACLARINETASALNAFCYLDEARTMNEAEASASRWAVGLPKGILDGVPVSIKDLIDVEGWPTMCGTKVIEPQKAIAKTNAITVERLISQGAVLLGKTTTTEFGHKGVSDCPLTGATHNPWNGAMTTGGSSCGAGAAAAAGLGPLHLGNDGGGSVRIPASFCGVVGIKPGAGTITHPLPSITGPLVAAGPLARSLADAALMLDALADRTGPSVVDGSANIGAQPFGGRLSLALALPVKGMRVGLLATISDAPVDPITAAAVRHGARLLSADGVTIKDAALDLPDAEAAYITILSAGTAMMADDYPAERLDLMEWGLKELIRVGRTITGQAYARAYHRVRGDFMARLRALFAQHDVLILPTMPQAAFPLFHDYPGPQDRGWRADWTPFTFPFNLCGLPACSIPCGLDESGLPIGLQIVAPWGGEEKLMTVAGAITRRLPRLVPPDFVTPDLCNATGFTHKGAR